MNYDNRIQPANAPASVSYAVSGAYERSQRGLENLFEAINSLRARIDPICSSGQDVKEASSNTSNAMPTTGVPMADKMLSQAELIERATDQLNDLFSRVQL